MQAIHQKCVSKWASIRLKPRACAPSLLHRGTCYGGISAFSTGKVYDCTGWMLDAQLVPAQGPTRLLISPGWRDFLEIVDVTESTLAVEADGTNQLITLTSVAESFAPVAEIRIPQHMDVHLDAGNADVTFTGKLEGDCLVTTRGGHVETASTIRGSNIRIDAGEGVVTVRRVLEASEMDIQCGGMQAKRLMGERIRVQAGPSAKDAGQGRDVVQRQHATSDDDAGPGLWGIHVESSYCSSAQYTSSGPGGFVCIDNHHGHVQADSQSGNVSVTGVTGSVEARAEAGGVTVQFDSIRDVSTLSCSGDITLSLVPPIHADLLLTAPGGVILKPGLTGVFRTDEKENERASDGDVFVIRGTLLVKEAAPSYSGAHGNVPQRKSFAAGATAPLGGAQEAGSGGQEQAKAGLSPRTSGGSGKIREDIHISGFYSAGAIANEGSNRPHPMSSSVEGQGRPRITAVSAHGTIVVEAVSWYDLVQRKMGPSR